MSAAPAKALAEAVGLSGALREEKLNRLRATVDTIRHHRDALDDASLRQASPLGAARALHG